MKMFFSRFCVLLSWFFLVSLLSSPFSPLPTCAAFEVAIKTHQPEAPELFIQDDLALFYSEHGAGDDGGGNGDGDKNKNDDGDRHRDDGGDRNGNDDDDRNKNEDGVFRWEERKRKEISRSFRRLFTNYLELIKFDLLKTNQMSAKSKSDAGSGWDSQKSTRKDAKRNRDTTSEGANRKPNPKRVKRDSESGEREEEGGKGHGGQEGDVQRDGFLISTFLRDLFRGYSEEDSEPTFVESAMPTEQKCRTLVCKELSTFLRSNMNQSADPCENFWDYACGAWQNRQIPNNKLSWGPVHIMIDQISAMQRKWLERKNENDSLGLAATTRKWYRTCMNESAMEGNVAVLKRLISGAGGWHAQGTLDRDWTVHRGITYLQQKNILIPFYDAKIVKDDKDVSRNLIKLYQPAVMFAKTPYYYNDNYRNQNIITGYLTTMSSLGQLLGLSPVAAKRFADTSFAFEKKLASILVPYDSELFFDAKNTYNIFQFGNLSSVCPFLDLQNIFRELSEEYFSNDDQDLLVFNHEFFLRLSSLLASASVEEMNNYMVWIVASSAERFLPQRFRDGLNNFRLVRYGHKEKHHRWLQCAKSAPFPFVMGRDFVKENFSETSREAAQKLIDNIREELIKGINRTDSFDQQTKDKAVEKLETMVTRIGYPNFILDEVKLAEFYSNYTFDNSSNLLQQRLDYLEHAKGKVIATLWLTNNRTDWITNPMLVNAFYHRIDNSITFPAGILQAPLFKKEYPDYHNYGSMGYIMGHEMVHGFDYNGAKYDSDGNLKEWMSEISKKTFDSKTQCISDFYSNLDIGGRNINGNITLGENIADIAGLKYAFRTYETEAAKKHPEGEPTLPGLHVSPQKTFFLSFASFHCKRWRSSIEDTLLSRVHAPSSTRVNGAVSQSEDFARVFQCPVGSKMNPEKKCNIF